MERFKIIIYSTNPLNLDELISIHGPMMANLQEMENQHQGVCQKSKSSYGDIILILHFNE
jgi:hypothetical protein